jgi:hypothetical protein
MYTLERFCIPHTRTEMAHVFAVISSGSVHKHMHLKCFCIPHTRTEMAHVFGVISSKSVQKSPFQHYSSRSKSRTATYIPNDDVLEYGDARKPGEEGAFSSRIGKIISRYAGA